MYSICVFVSSVRTEVKVNSYINKCLLPAAHWLIHHSWDRLLIRNKELKQDLTDVWTCLYDQRMVMESFFLNAKEAHLMHLQYIHPQSCSKMQGRNGWISCTLLLLHWEHWGHRIISACVVRTHLPILCPAAAFTSEASLDSTKQSLLPQLSICTDSASHFIDLILNTDYCMYF